MRIGIYLPHLAEDGTFLDSAGIAERASRIEDAGFESIWMGDHLPLPGEHRRDRPDPLLYLSIAAHATEHIELGTCIYCVPLRNKYEVAQRLYSLQTLSPGRFTIGVGTGSQRREYEAAGLEWDDRFRMLRESMEAIDAVFSGGPAFESPTGAPSLADPAGGPTWAQQVGRPRLALGAWHSAIQLERAATEYSGWLASGGGFNQRILRGERLAAEADDGHPKYGSWTTTSEAVATYRSFGGTRAILSTVTVDLDAETTPMHDEGHFNLNCDPTEAAERLEFLESLGFDDIILTPNRRGDESGHPYGYSAEQLERIRALVPPDTRPIDVTR